MNSRFRLAGRGESRLQWEAAGRDGGRHPSSLTPATYRIWHQVAIPAFLRSAWALLSGKPIEGTVLEDGLEDQRPRDTPPSRWERVRANPTTVSIASAFTDCSRPSLGRLTATAAIGST